MDKDVKPYWGFWKVVFAGWLIQYPGKIFRALLWFILITSMGVGYILTTPQREGTETLENPTLDTYMRHYENDVFNFFTE